MSDNKQPQVKLKGLCMYASVLPGQERAPHPDQIAEGKATEEDRAYSIQVECSRELFEKLEDMKIPPATKLKKYDDQPGKTYLNIRGTKKKLWTDRLTGEVKTLVFENPVVTDEKEQPWDVAKEIGNGSVVEVTANLDKIKGRSGHVLRLASVKVLDHVPYESKPKETETVLSGDSGVTKAQPPVAEETDQQLTSSTVKVDATKDFF